MLKRRRTLRRRFAVSARDNVAYIWVNYLDEPTQLYLALVAENEKRTLDMLEDAIEEDWGTDLEMSARFGDEGIAPLSQLLKGKALQEALRQLEYADIAIIDTPVPIGRLKFSSKRSHLRKSQFGLPPTMADEVEQISVKEFFNENGYVRDWNQVDEEIDSWGGGPGQSFGTAYAVKKIGPKGSSREDVAAAQRAAEKLTKEWEALVGSDPYLADNFESSGYRFEVVDLGDGYYLILTEYAWDV